MRRWGEERGFRASVEHQLPDGGRVDVALELEGLRLACEISVSSTAEHETGNVRKCLEAGFDRVVVVSLRKRLLGELGKRLKEELSESEQNQIELLSPEGLLELLERLAPDDSEDTIAGYKVNVSYREPTEIDTRARQRAVSEVIKLHLAREV